jgi:hypothetical protein
MPRYGEAAQKSVERATRGRTLKSGSRTRSRAEAGDRDRPPKRARRREGSSVSKRNRMRPARSTGREQEVHVSKLVTESSVSRVRLRE